jgi:hypothetical protein
MTIRYTCAECGAVLNIKDELAGTQGHCPRCQVEFTVPAAEGSTVVGKKPAALAGEPSAEGQGRPPGGLSEDDIGALLAAGGPVTSTADSRDAGNGSDEALSEADVADESAHDAEDDDDDSGRRRKKKGKRGDKSAANKETVAESASIAKGLMARGEHAVSRDEKKAGRPFGGAEGRAEERPDYTAKDVVKYFASIGWPGALAVVVVFGLCFGLYYWLSPSIKLPPLAAVAGTITLDGKPPPPNTIVKFQPTMEGPNQNLYLGTSFGFTDDKGHYTLIYQMLNEKRIMGAVIGKHVVTINYTQPTGEELFPLRYSNTSQSILKQEVVKGGPPINFDLKSGEVSAP